MYIYIYMYDCRYLSDNGSIMLFMYCNLVMMLSIKFSNMVLLFSKKLIIVNCKLCFSA